MLIKTFSNYNNIYSQISIYEVLFQTVSYGYQGELSACIDPFNTPDGPYTTLPAFGVTTSIFVIGPQDNTQTFLNLIDAASCVLIPEGPPIELGTVALLTITSSFVAKPEVSNTTPRTNPSPLITSTAISVPSMTQMKESVAIPFVTSKPGTEGSEPKTIPQVSSSGSTGLISAADSASPSPSPQFVNPSRATQYTSATSQLASNPSAASALISSLLGKTPPGDTLSTAHAVNNPVLGSSSETQLEVVAPNPTQGAKSDESSELTQAGAEYPSPIQASQGQASSQVAPANDEPPGVIIESSVLTANSASQFIIDSSTLIPGGPAVTIEGTLVSLAPLTALQNTGPAANAPATANLLMLSVCFSLSVSTTTSSS